MKLAIATSADQLCNHFGGCTHFAIYSVEGDTVTRTDTPAAPPHQPGLLPRWLHELGVNAVIAGGMGARACALLEELGIEAIIGAHGENPDELARLYAAGQLESGGSTCSGHQMHGDDCHH